MRRSRHMETEVQDKAWFPIPCRQAGAREPGREQPAKAEVYKFPPRAGSRASRSHHQGHPTAAGGEWDIPRTRPGWV